MACDDAVNAALRCFFRLGQYSKYLLIATIFFILGFYLSQSGSLRPARDLLGQSQDEPNIGEIVFKIQSDLAKLAEKRLIEGMPKLFSPNTMEVELSFVVKRDATGGAKLEFTPVVVEAGTNYAKEQVQRVKLSFTALESKEESSGKCNPEAFGAEPLPIPPIPKR